jgi:hypothetical protein
VTQDLEPTDSRAIITRNTYGALILNAAQALFIDVDMPEARGIARIGAIFGRRSKEDEILKRIRAGLGAAPARKFRIYRTAGGFRVLALDREFDPTASDTEALMKAVGGDPQYIQLCKVQKSFRARLTPKPWRCGCSTPPSAFPREDTEALSTFAAWLQGYEAACAGKATCRFIEEIGTGEVVSAVRSILECHDRLTRALEPLPLA